MDLGWHKAKITSRDELIIREFPKENGSLIAGILGFSGLAWAHFFKASTGTET
jgi:hypothetical protein